jgi:hypothetical protein
VADAEVMAGGANVVPALVIGTKLDLCAGPVAKTSALASQLGAQSLQLCALDPAEVRPKRNTQKNKKKNKKKTTTKKQKQKQKKTESITGN